MKGKKLILMLAALLSAAFTLTLHAQTSAFTYQGRLTDANGPANGTYDLQFTIYDAGTGGNVVAGPITNSAVAVTNGLFTTTLDFGAGVFNGSDRWLEIGVATNGSGAFTNLSPRQLITSTPYAIQAANAANAGSVAAANITGTVGLAQLPTTVLLTNGASGVNISGTFSGDGAGLTNVNLLYANTQGAIAFSPVYGNFVPASSPGVGSGPLAVTAADVNGDGHPDLISANAGDDTLTILTNDGSGGFVLASSPGVGSGPYSVTAADVNGDGHPDLISANAGDDALTILTNDGSGGFVLASSPGVGSNPQSVAAADVNGDGHPDLISANYSVSTLTILTNDGSGGFVLASSPGVGSNPQSVAAADVNGDGHPDLITANFTANTLTVLTNNGSGGFMTASTLNVGQWPVFVTAADVNGDGYLDLIGANRHDQTLTVLTNDGSGGFMTASTLSVAGHPQSVTTADVNGDGHPDLISANGSANTLTVLTNDGSGGFVQASSPGVGNQSQSVAAADVNSDGHPDLISANKNDNTLTVLFNVPASYSGSFTGDGSGLTGLSASRLTGTLSANSIAAGSITSVMLASNSVGAAQLTDNAVTADKFSTATGGFLTRSIFEPNTHSGDSFGNSVAAVGADKLLIGAPGNNTGAGSAGAAYLLSLNGTLLTMYTNPIPQSGDIFGSAVAAVGADKVLVGTPFFNSTNNTNATLAGTAYLFSTNGTFLTTIANPTPRPNDYFGYAVAGVGTDKVLIGAPGNNTGALEAGAAYLFDTSGTLLTTFTNPAPQVGDEFGYVVAAVGTDKLLVGAPNHSAGVSDSGVAYLFSTNGALLATLTDPTPKISGKFGGAVAAMGQDKLLVGAPEDDIGATEAGVAYLFSTNGTLLATFSNPTPQDYDRLGSSVAAVGEDKVLVGTPGDSTGARQAGAAYLFSTNGTLLATLTDPTSQTTDFFGTAVAAVGADQLLIGAYGVDNSAGVAYLYQVSTYTPGLVAAGLVPDTVVQGTFIATQPIDLNGNYLSGDGDNEGVFVDKNGNVGIDTTSPDRPLTIQANGRSELVSLKDNTGTTRWHINLQSSGLNFAETSVADYRLFLQEGGNVGIGTSSPTHRLQVAGDVAATTFITTSDRNVKRGFQPVSPTEVLRKVAALPITTWQFKTDHDGRHMGPMAQDFHAAFGLGDTDKGIATVDEDGVALAAIQGLNQKMETGDQKSEARSQRSEVRIQKLETENAELKQKLNQLVGTVNKLNREINGGAR